MKARVKATGEIVEVCEVTKYDSNYNPIVYYKDEGGFPHKKEQLDFEDLTQGKADVKEKSFPKDEPDYWEKLKHQYAGMAMQSYVNNNVYLSELRKMCKEPREMRDYIADLSIALATALVNRLKEEEK